MLRRAKILPMLLAWVCGLVFYAPVAAQDLTPKTTTYEIESVGLDGLQLLTTIEYPQGKETPFEAQLQITNPDENQLEMVNMDWEGTGSCESTETMFLYCTGDITYVQFAFRYTYPVTYSGKYFALSIVEAEPDGADYTGIVQYPESLEVAFTSHAPTTEAAGQLLWDVASMYEFQAGVVFLDPSISTVFLPLLRQ